ncbi:MAG: glycerol-3-phosphate acyltransferase [Nibricoccus sp.]
MTLTLSWVPCLLAAYALGCINTGYLFVRWRTGRDIRTQGSGNAGATNVGRVLGPPGFGVTLLGDALKGSLVILGARFVGLDTFPQLLAIAAVIAGHNWPVNLGFRGGKGVATSLGALVFFDPALAGLLLGACALFLALTRRSTVSAMIAYAAMPVVAASLGYDGPCVALLGIIAGILIFPHRHDLLEELGDQPPVSHPTSSAGDFSPSSGLQLKIATESWEFEAIHRLNHRTFVEEIPQHGRRPNGRLVDRFHSENTYLVALRGRQLVGMIALRARRPFSLDAKVEGLDGLLPQGHRAIEARLLAVEPAFRSTAVFAALFSYVVNYCRDAGHDLAVVSATTRQLKLYRHLGFTAFGPLVGTAAASFQPMYLTIEAFDRIAARSPSLNRFRQDRPASPRPRNFLTGPVQTTPAVDDAFAAPPRSHRSPEFLAQMERVRSRLRDLTGARHVQIAPGSGSLATAIVAAQLSLRPCAGFVLSNGEFGERLAAESARAQLCFETLSFPWGTPLDLQRIEERAARLPRGSWLWAVHHETSTGMLNPLPELKTLAAKFHLRLCLDCISTIGSQPVDLRGVHLASGASGKGLGAYPGLALVFHHDEPTPQPGRIPSYLDLGHWAAHASTPHTHSSNLIAALDAALRTATPDRMTRIRENAAWLRDALHNHGFEPIVADAVASPDAVTIALGQNVSSKRLGEELERCGYLLNFRSRHLLERNWIQIALFGDPSRADLVALVGALSAAHARICPRSATASPSQDVADECGQLLNPSAA